MGSMFNCATVCKSNLLLRYLSITLVFVFLIWQLNIVQYDPACPTKRTRTHSSDQLPTSDTSNGFEEPQSSRSVSPQCLPETEGQNTELRSRIAKVTSIYYNHTSYTTRMYEQALLTHQEHNKRWGYQHFVQRRGELGPWSKHLYILKLLVDELEKPPSQRLGWLFWHDADVLLVNNHIPLETFLPPPAETWAHVNFLASNDLLGLNIGVFLIRVREWSVYFLAAGLSNPYFRPEVRLRHDEQGPLNMLVTEKKFKNNTIHVPQSWFNPYQNSGHDQDDNNDDSSIPPEWNWRLTYFAPGDLLIHFPGTKATREQLMQEYIDRRAANWNLYNRPLNETRAHTNITHFWQEDAKHESKRQLDYWRAYHVVYHDVGPGEAMITRNGIEEIKSMMEGNATQEEIDDAIDKYTAARIAPERESYRKA